MKFKFFSQAQFSNGINGVGEFRYDIILYVVKISYESGKWFGNCWGGDRNFTQTHAHAHTHTHTHRHTHRHTHTGCPFYVFFFKKETRLKKKQKPHYKVQH